MQKKSKKKTGCTSALEATILRNILLRSLFFSQSEHLKACVQNPNVGQEEPINHSVGTTEHAKIFKKRANPRRGNTCDGGWWVACREIHQLSCTSNLHCHSKNTLKGETSQNWIKFFLLKKKKAAWTQLQRAVRGASLCRPVHLCECRLFFWLRKTTMTN